MKEKRSCDKYEANFIFKGDREFLEHVKICADCQKEYEKQIKISKLIREVAPIYKKREEIKRRKVIKRIACCMVIFVGLMSYTGYNMYDNYRMQQDIMTDSYISSLGLPIDDYGFLEI